MCFDLSLVFDVTNPSQWWGIFCDINLWHLPCHRCPTQDFGNPRSRKSQKKTARSGNKTCAVFSNARRWKTRVLSRILDCTRNERVLGVRFCNFRRVFGSAKTQSFGFSLELRREVWGAAQRWVCDQTVRALSPQNRHFCWGKKNTLVCRLFASQKTFCRRVQPSESAKSGLFTWKCLKDIL